MRRLCLLLLLIQMAAWGASRRSTADDVVAAVFASLYSDHDERRLAEQLEHIRLEERLDASLLVYFRNLGAGQLTLDALQRLSDKSRLLPLPAERPVKILPLPKADEKAQMLGRLFEYAQSYVHGLPNFICDQVTRRYTNFGGLQPDGNPRYRKSLRHSDTFTRSLRFVGGAEEGRIEEVNGKRAARGITRQGQSISAGEFGGDMVIIFGADVTPAMQWDHWESYRGERRAVFSFFVGQPKTKFSLFYCCYRTPDGREMQQSYNSPVRGLVYMDPDKGTIERLLIRAVDLPGVFHIKESNTVIDYGRVSIGGQSYTLPLRAVTFGRTDTQFNRNEIAFVKYRKFEAESVLTFTHSKIIGYGPAPKK